MNKFLGSLIVLIWSISAFGQTTQSNEWLLRQRLPDWVNNSFNKLNLQTKYIISDYINPFYLEADFNGDNKLDIAVAVEEKETTKRGFIIFHFSSQDNFVIGAGNSIGNGGDNFNWMDIWKVHRDTKVHEVTYKENSDIDDSRPVNLKNTGILVEKSESASGIISWDGKKYIWTQVGD